MSNPKVSFGLKFTFLSIIYHSKHYVFSMVWTYSSCYWMCYDDSKNFPSFDGPVIIWAFIEYKNCKVSDDRRYSNLIGGIKYCYKFYSKKIKNKNWELFVINGCACSVYNSSTRVNKVIQYPVLKLVVLCYRFLIIFSCDGDNSTSYHDPPST